MVMMAAFVGCLVMMLAGCTADNKLKLAAEAANKKCPVSMGAVGDVESITYEDGEVVYTLAINEQLSNMQAMKENPEDMKQMVLTNFANPEGNQKTMLDLIIDANASLRFVYKGKESGETIEMALTADEVKAAADNTSLTAEDKLNAEVNATNMQLPMSIDDATVLEKMVVEGNSVVYLYKIDESILNIDDMKINADDAKQNVKTSLVNGGPAVHAFLKKVLDTNRDLRYRYIGSESGNSTEFVFTPDELQDMLK